MHKCYCSALSSSQWSRWLRALRPLATWPLVPPGSIDALLKNSGALVRSTGRANGSSHVFESNSQEFTCLRLKLVDVIIYTIGFIIIYCSSYLYQTLLNFLLFLRECCTLNMQAKFNVFAYARKKFQKNARNTSKLLI